MHRGDELTNFNVYRRFDYLSSGHVSGLKCCSVRGYRRGIDPTFQIKASGKGAFRSRTSSSQASRFLHHPLNLISNHPLRYGPLSFSRWVATSRPDGASANITSTQIIGRLIPVQQQSRPSANAVYAPFSQFAPSRDHPPEII